MPVEVKTKKPSKPKRKVVRKVTATLTLPIKTEMGGAVEHLELLQEGNKVKASFPDAARVRSFEFSVEDFMELARLLPQKIEVVTKDA